MARIPLSALRRALAALSTGLREGAGDAYHGFHIDRGATYGSIPGAVIGGAAGAASAPEDATPDERYSRIAPGMALGILGGAGVGAIGGLGAKGIAMLSRGAGMGGFTLRRALAQMAEERGLTRAAQRDMTHAGDAARFADASGQLDDVAPRSSMHGEPDAIEPDMDVDDAMGGMGRLLPTQHADDIAASAQREVERANIPMSGIKMIRTKLDAGQPLTPGEIHAASLVPEYFTDEQRRMIEAMTASSSTPTYRGRFGTSGMGRTGYE